MITFHDYILLQSLNETYPGIVEIHGGEIVFDEFLGFGAKKKPKYNPANDASYNQWAGQMAGAGMNQPQQEPYGKDAAQWGQQMTQAGFAGVNPGQQQQPPQQQQQPQPQPQQQQPMGQPGQPGQQQGQQGGGIKVDYKMLQDVLGKIQTPKLKQIMQNWMQQTFKQAA